MAFKICQTLRPQYLLVEVFGTYDGSSAVELLPLVLSACRLNATDKVLIDYRRMEDQQTVGDRAAYALEISALYESYLADGGTPLRIAYLGTTSQVGPFDPGSIIAQQKALPFHSTTNLDDALSWLRVEEA